MKLIKVILIMTFPYSSLLAMTFSLTFNCPKKFGRVCLHGHWPKGKQFILFSDSDKDNSTCRVTTADQFVYSDEVVGFDATTLKSLDGCLKTKKYFLAKESKGKVKFKHLHLQDVKNVNVLKKVNISAKNANLPFLALKTSKQSVKYKKSDILSTIPNVKKVMGFSEDIFLLEYAMTFTKKGPSYVWSNGKFQSISDVCSLAPRAFMINSSLFLMAGASCCECGWFSKKIYQYDNGKFKKVYANGDWST